MDESKNKLLEIVRDLSEKEIEQVITFAEFLIYQRNKKVEEIGDKTINKNIDVLMELEKY